MWDTGLITAALGKGDFQVAAAGVTPVPAGGAGNFTLQIGAVPEPSTIVMAGIAGLVGLGVGRRRTGFRKHEGRDLRSGEVNVRVRQKTRRSKPLLEQVLPMGSIYIRGPANPARGDGWYRQADDSASGVATPNRVMRCKARQQVRFWSLVVDRIHRERVFPHLTAVRGGV